MTTSTPPTLASSQEGATPWPRVPFADVIQDATAGFASGKRDENGLVQLRMNNVDRRGGLSWEKITRVPHDPKRLEKYRLVRNDVLFNNTNSVELVGKSALFEGFDEPVVYSNHFTRLRGKPHLLDQKYLALWLLTEWNRRTFEHLCNRWVGQAAVKWDKLKRLSIPLPPLAEQRRIAARLEEQMAHVARARAAAQTRLAAATSLPAAYLRQVFNSPEARTWPRRTIGDVAKVQSGYAFKSEWFSDKGIRLIRNANVHQGRVVWNDVVRIPFNRRREFAAYELAVGDIILALDRPIVSSGLKLVRLTDADVPSLLLQRVGRFRLNADILPGFLHAYLQSQFFIDAIAGHDQSLGVPHISPKQVEAVELPIPPTEEQRNIVGELEERTAAAARLSGAAERELAAIDALSAALLREAFNGAN